MAIQSEVWVRYIMNRLWKENKFLQYAFNDDQYVIAGKIVHIPNPGSKPNVVKNRSSYPATAVQRTDTDVTYTLDKYSTDPTHIEAADTMEISYDKITSVWGDHAGQLTETIATDMILKWLATPPAVVATSGGATGALVTGQTGTRKVLLASDLKKCQLKMNLADVPKNDRYVLLESNRLDELTSDLSQTQYRDFSKEYDAANGVVGKLYGFNILERSTVAIAATGTNAIAALGAAVGATDNVACMAWQKDAVARAIGEKKFFENIDDALYQGDIYSALLRAGGRRRRADDAGVVAIVQG